MRIALVPLEDVLDKLTYELRFVGGSYSFGDEIAYWKRRGARFYGSKEVRFDTWDRGLPLKDRPNRKMA